MINTKLILFFSVIILLLIQPVFAILNVQHSVDGNKVTITYQGTAPFWINIRGDTNIGQAGGYLWAKTYSNSFTYDMGFAINPSKKFYYGVKDNSWSSINSFFTNQKCDNNLLLDIDTNICMEEVVFNQVRNIKENLKICETNCDALPKPTISLDGGYQIATYKVLLNGKIVTHYIVPWFTINSNLIDNPQNVLDLSTHWVNGASEIKFLIPSEGNYFQNFYTILSPNKESVVNYKIIKREGIYGNAYFFIQEDDKIFDLDSISKDFDKVSKTNSNLAGLSQPEKYYLIAVPPDLFSIDGGFYMGNNMFEITYGGDKYYNITRYQRGKNIFQEEFSHEYTHLLQEKLNLYQYYDSGILTEGMADAVSIYNGFRRWEDVGFDGNIQPGCLRYVNTNPQPHTVGRCIFKQLDQEGYFTNHFFTRLFHPKEKYSLLACSDNLLDTQKCKDELIRLLSYLTETDMTNFVKEKIQV